jgi:hypothetical protein
LASNLFERTAFERKGNNFETTLFKQTAILFINYPDNYFIVSFINLTDCNDASSWMIGDYCYNVYPNAQLDPTDFASAYGFCQTKMKMGGQLLQYNASGKILLKLQFI